MSCIHVSKTVLSTWGSVVNEQTENLAYSPVLGKGNRQKINKYTKQSKLTSDCGSAVGDVTECRHQGTGEVGEGVSVQGGNK